VLRQWEGSSTNQVAIVVGVAEDVFNLQALHSAQNSSANVELRIGIGEGSTTSMVSSLRTGRTIGIPANQTSNMMAILQKLPAVGYQFYAGLEQSDATGTTTWLGDVGGTTAEQGGLLGGIQG
jgi:ABC-type hemin transport system substrate-binding protein